MPVIGSLNGTTPAGWLEYAKLIEQAGADALELNLYYLATSAWETGEQVESRTLDTVKAVKSAVKIPLAVKLSPYFSSFAHFAHQLDELGANGLVMFNRFYQPDIDVEELEVVPRLPLSNPPSLLLRLRWIAICYGHVKADIACSGGVHTGLDALKAVMAGANAVQMVSALLHNGPEHLTKIRDEVSTLARGARVRVARAGARLDEPRELPEPAGARARQLHEGAADLAAVDSVARGQRSVVSGQWSVRSKGEGRERFPPLGILRCGLPPPTHPLLLFRRLSRRNCRCFHSPSASGVIASAATPNPGR